MQKFFILIFLLLSNTTTGQFVLVLKKRNETEKNYWKGQTIVFLHKNKQWQSGIIVEIKKDSFTITPTAIYYSRFGVDTIKFINKTFGLNDIYAIPKKGIIVDYQKGYFDVSKKGGQDFLGKFKSGNYFIIGGLGYIALNTININQDNFSSKAYKSDLILASSFLGAGLFLKFFNKPYIKIKRQYKFETKKL